MACVHCGVQIAAASRFCQTCGTPQEAGAKNATLAPWKAKYVDGYYRGQIKSAKGEVWTFENGLVRGPVASYAWLGDVLRKPEREDTDHGHGNYDGKVLSWTYADMGTLYEYSIAADEARLECVSMAEGTARWTWQLQGTRFWTEGTEALEGTEDEWEVTGDVSLPVVLFVAMFGKAQRLHQRWEERNRRQYRRCGKLVLRAGKHPRLCGTCSAEGGESCMTCGSGGELPFDGNYCKSCAPKVGLCGRCGDPLKGSKTPGKLCNGCGLGSRGMNCCRMVYSN